MYGLIYFKSFMKISLAKMIKNEIKTIVAITLRFDKPLYFYVGLNCSQRSRLLQLGIDQLSARD